MRANRLLRRARAQTGFTQRQLAERAGVSQPAIARIESGRTSPTVATLDRLLAACGQEVSLARRLGEGVDRTVIRELLRATPRERLELAVQEARNLERLGAAARR